MRDFIAERFGHIKPTLAFDAKAVAKYHDLVDLSIGDTDIITDEKIIDRAMADAKNGYTRYGDPKGDPELIAKIIEYYKEEYSIDVPAGEVTVTPSSCMGMALVMIALLNPGDEVVVFSPYFSIYKQQIEVAGGVCVDVPTFENDNWAPQREALEKAVTPRTKAIVMNNPGNPTGAVYPVQTLQMIADVAQEHDLLVLADEIYTDFVFIGSFVPMISFPGMRERTITLNSFSKNYMMTGWRIGYIVAQKRFVDVIKAVNGAMVYTSPSISQRAAIEAINIRQETREKYITVYRKRVEYAEERIRRIGYFSMAPAAGTFYVFPSIKATGLTSREFTALMLKECHVLATPGSAFGSAGEGYVRFSLTQSMEQIADAFDRLEKLSF